MARPRTAATEGPSALSSGLRSRAGLFHELRAVLDVVVLGCLVGKASGLVLSGATGDKLCQEVPLPGDELGGSSSVGPSSGPTRVAFEHRLQLGAHLVPAYFFYICCGLSS